MAVFIVIFFSFCGALTLSLCYSESNENQELRCVSVEYISLTKLWSCFGKNNLGYRLLQVSKIFDNFLWTLLNLICSLLARCLFIQTILILSGKSNLLIAGILMLNIAREKSKKKPQHINFLFFILPLVVLERSSWAGFVHCSSSIPWCKITHLSSTWHWSFKLLLSFTLRLTAVTIWVLKASSGKLRSQVISGL